MKGMARVAGIVGLMAVMMCRFASAAAGDPPVVPKADLPHYVYSDKGMAEEGYGFAPSGWMGNTDAIDLDECCADTPHDGDCCMRITFDDARGWGGVVWQNPAENWGDDEGGLDLTGARQLSFWARGEKGGEIVEFKMGVLKQDKRFFDTASVSLGKVKLSKAWKQYTVNLLGKDLTRIVTGFCFSVKGKADPITFYLDDIVYE